MMTVKTRRSYTAEFKAEAISLVHTSDRSVTDIASGLGIKPNLLHRWLREYNHEQQPTPTRIETKDEELRRLRTELQNAREDNEVLKKAAAYFAKHQR